MSPLTSAKWTLAVGKEIERELCDEVDHPRENPKPAQHLTVGIDGAFVKARRSAAGERRQFEILTGRIERQRGRGEVFAIVRDLDGRAKQKVQAVLAQCQPGSSPATGSSRSWKASDYVQPHDRDHPGTARTAEPDFT